MQKQLLQLFDQSIYFTMVQNFQTLFENFDLVNMSKSVISKSNISKTDISYLKLFENFEPP